VVTDTEFESPDDDPDAFTLRRVIVYDVDPVRPVIVAGLDVIPVWYDTPER
jgi:hypothetical protein